MSISFVNVSSNLAFPTGTSLATSYPASIVKGDALLLFCRDADPTTPSQNANWAWGSGILIENSHLSAQNWDQGCLFWIYDGVTAAPTLTWDGSSQLVGWAMAAYRANDTSMAAAQHAQFLRNTTVALTGTAPAVTGQNGGIWVAGAFNTNGATVNSFTGFTSRINNVNGIAIYDKAIAANGSTGTQALTWTNNSDIAVYSVALNPVQPNPQGYVAAPSYAASRASRV